MKRHLHNIVLTAGLSVLLGSSTLSAQSQKAVANIPFAYHVGENTLSPGKYAIAKTSAEFYYMEPEVWLPPRAAANANESLASTLETRVSKSTLRAGS
jgi:hypothetical protein